ncbi:MAG: ACT domain-containing protein [Candidatus Methanofastidiosa archaeon]|nr:ACT domain-containing protein [Candidatus Methanofastidiosa archaeon]
MVYQISIFLENRPNRLYSVTEALREGNINLRAAMIAEAGDFGIVRAIVDDPDMAFKILEEKNFSVKKTQVVGVEVPDGPGGLSDIARVLGSNDINIIYLYAFTVAGKNMAFLILKTDDNQKAKKIIKEQLGLRTISQRDINEL